MKTQIFLILAVCLVMTQAWPWAKSGPTTFDRFSEFKYQNQTADQKMSQLWKEVTADTKSNGWYSTFNQLAFLFTQMKPTFDTYSDVLPEGRKKYIHTTGSVAQAEFVAEKENNPYTGMFKGAKNVLIRFSTAKQPDGTKDAKLNFIPGFGIKLLRDGMPSANLVAMYEIEGNPSWNVFKYDYTHHVPNPQAGPLKLLAKKFAQATPYFGRIGLKTWGSHDESGKKVADKDMKIPYKLVFKPAARAVSLFPDDHYGDTLDNQIATLPVGFTLYDVMAVSGPGEVPVKIGSIKLRSKFTTSMFGDKHLFFQHNYVEDDLEIHPEWKKAIEMDPPIMTKLMEEFHK